MKISIQAKLFFLCIVLVLLTIAGISTTYYVLTKQDKQRESRQRVQIALDIILHDLNSRLQNYATRFKGYLEKDINLRWTADAYKKNEGKLSSPHFIVSRLAKVAESVRSFGAIISADRLSLYAANKRLLVVYQSHDEQETVGGYVIAKTGDEVYDTYVSMDNYTQLSSMYFGNKPVPKAALPDGIAKSYTGEIPDAISANLFSEGMQVGIRVIAPVYHHKEKAAVLVGEVFYTQEMAEHYASLSKTDVNIFAKEHLSVGTLPAQTELSPETLEHVVPCEEIFSAKSEIDITPVLFDDKRYYQGQCIFKDAQQNVTGAITASLSQNVERQEIRKLLKAVFMISMIVSGLAFAFTVIFSRKWVIFPVRRIISGVNRGTEQIASSSVQVASASHSLAEGNSEQAATSEEISSSLEEVACMVRQNADNSGLADNFMKEVGQVIEKANESVNRLTGSMEEIIRASRETSGLVKTIDEIAFQTNLLALNAAVEAARAGEAGGGFAVVAEEVRNLAMRATQAARNTSGLIEETLKKIQTGGEITSETSKAFEEVASYVSKVGKLITEIAGTSGEQAHRIGHLNNAVSETDKLTQKNAADAEEMASASEEMKAQVRKIKILVNELTALISEKGNNTVLRR